jgi:hypothetical protein
MDGYMIGSRYEFLPDEWGTVTNIRGIGANWGPVLDLTLDSGVEVSHLRVNKEEVA